MIITKMQHLEELSEDVVEELQTSRDDLDILHSKLDPEVKQITGACKKLCSSLAGAIELANALALLLPDHTESGKIDPFVHSCVPPPPPKSNLKSAGAGHGA